MCDHQLRLASQTTGPTTAFICSSAEYDIKRVRIPINVCSTILSFISLVYRIYVRVRYGNKNVASGFTKSKPVFLNTPHKMILSLLVRSNRKAKFQKATTPKIETRLRSFNVH